jgi:hypothetical protein
MLSEESRPTGLFKAMLRDVSDKYQRADEEWSQKAPGTISERFGGLLDRKRRATCCRCRHWSKGFADLRESGENVPFTQGTWAVCTTNAALVLTSAIATVLCASAENNPNKWTLP